MQNALTKKLMKYLRKRKKVGKLLRGSKVFHGVIYELFPKIKKTFDSMGVNYFLCFGTLLGAIREHDFIPHDDDLEIGVFGDEYSGIIEEKLLTIGFKRLLRYHVETENPFPHEGYMEKYSNGTIDIDLFVFSRTEEKYWCYTYLKDEWNSILTLKLCWENDGLEKIDFLGMNVPVPKYPEKHLAATYGETWNVPIVYWEDTMHANIESKSKEIGRIEFVDS